ncbi:MAG TPA: helix-turn-helix transcriptional regulator [Thermoanaerobaculia bacterium]|nr:helix-turn-helix transcriptional regulator [Thermoanaerobaculia bacterium]
MGESFRPATSIALAMLRTLRGWDQKDLAAAVRLHPDSISDYERGKKKVPSGAALPCRGRGGARARPPRREPRPRRGGEGRAAGVRRRRPR